MGKSLISIIALAALAFTVWLLLVKPEPVSSDGLSTPMGIAPEQDAPAVNLAEVEVVQPTGKSSSTRSALEQAAPEAREDKRSDAAPVPTAEEEHGDSVLEVLVVNVAYIPIKGATATPNEVVDGLLGSTRIRRPGFAGPKTNDQGLIVLAPDIEGLMRVVATAEGYAPGASEVFELGEVTGRVRVKVILTVGGSAEGRLLDIHGGPAEDVRITIHLNQWAGTVGRSTTSVMQSADTAEDGSFLFEALTPGAYTLYTRATGERVESVPNEQVNLEVKVGERTVVAFAEISESFVRVHGLVLRNSEPLANARISIKWADRKRGYLGKKVTTDGDGRFTIILDEGANYRFQISPKGPGGTVFREIEIPSVESHEVEISFDTGSISGHLLGPDREPVEGMEVTAFGKSALQGSGTTYQSVTSQAGGAFELLDLVDGTYKLVAKTISTIPEPAAAPKNPYFGGAELKDLELAAGEIRKGVELQLSGAAAVSGTVTDQAGEAVAGATVELRGMTPLDNSHWRADKSGVFLAGGLKPGEYRVRATRQTELSAWVAVRASVKSTTPVEGLVLQTGSMIHIEAVMGGESAGRVYARIQTDDGPWFSDSTIFRDGKGQLGPVLPGTYTVTIAQVGGDKKKASRTLIVDGATPHEFRIEIQP